MTMLAIVEGICATSKSGVNHTCNNIKHLLPLRDDLGDGVPDDDTGLLGFFLCQAAGHAYFESGYGCPASIARVDAQAEWEGFESCDEYAVRETL